MTSELHMGSEQVSQKQLYWSSESLQYSHLPYVEVIGSFQQPWRNSSVKWDMLRVESVVTVVTVVTISNHSNQWLLVGGVNHKLRVQLRLRT